MTPTKIWAGLTAMLVIPNTDSTLVSGKTLSIVRW